MRLIFDRESAAVFEPHKPERLQRRILAVYRYAVRQENSHYTLEYGYSRILTAYHGRVYIDPSTGRVLQLTTEVDPPPDFPIRETSTTIDYGFRAIGVEEYLLPVHAEVRTFELPSEEELKHLSRSYRDLARRGIRYHNYRGVPRLSQILDRLDGVISLRGLARYESESCQRSAQHCPSPDRHFSRS